MSGRLALIGPDRELTDALRLGRSDYSYHFVMKYYAAALADTFDLVSADERQQLDSDIPSIAFLPPHRLPRNPPPRMFAAFAWEYDTIPTDVWNDDERNDWRRPLGRIGGSIVHSQFALRAVAAAMPAGYPLCSAPAPVWDDYAPLASQPKPDAWALEYDGWLLDTRAAGLDRDYRLPDMDFTVAPHRVAFEGVVYTCVVNPDDGRKNWVDAMSAFTIAFRDNPDVTLIIKLVHHDPVRAGLLVADMIYRAAPYRCRVVVVFGYLEPEQYRQMIVGSSFVVNSSRGEGQCLPLMEFMSAGVPAVAPDHTAMAEYVGPANAFVVSTYRERTHWPHDPRLMLRCMHYGIDWKSLHDALLDSYAVRFTPGYAAMRTAASRALRGYASRAVVRETLAGFLPGLQSPGPPPAQWAARR